MKKRVLTNSAVFILNLTNNSIAIAATIIFLADLYWMLEEVTPEQQNLTAAIIDFVMTEEPCDIDILRRALYCQVTHRKPFLVFVCTLNIICIKFCI